MWLQDSLRQNLFVYVPACVSVLVVCACGSLCVSVCACIFEKEMVKHADSEAQPQSY